MTLVFLLHSASSMTHSLPPRFAPPAVLTNLQYLVSASPLAQSLLYLLLYPLVYPFPIAHSRPYPFALALAHPWVCKSRDTHKAATYTC
jgi:hypothetical protein